MNMTMTTAARRWRLLPLGLAAGMACPVADAATFQLQKVRLPGGAGTVSGTVTTDGTVGPLTAANLTGWDVTIERVTLHTYTPADAGGVQLMGVSVSADGRKMTVRTSPDGVSDGGLLAFGSFGPGPEHGVQVGNFTGPYAAGGTGFYLDGAAFDWNPLNAPNRSRWVAAKAAAGSTVFKLVSQTFPGGAVLSGSITTDGQTGALAPANVLDWNLSARESAVTRWYRDATGGNSSVWPGSTGLSTDGATLYVARPGGYLGFGVPPTPGRIGAAAVLADFSADAPSRGRAGYFDAFGAEYVSLKFSGTAWPVATVVP